MTRLLCVLSVVLLFVVSACGSDDAETPTVAPSITPTPANVTGAPTATRAPTATTQPTPTAFPSHSPQTTAAAPAGLMRLADPPHDVTDVNGQPVEDASRFVDLTAAELQIDGASLILTVDTGGPLPSALDAGDEMWWALELVPPDASDITLYRVTVKFSGMTWQTINYDFEHDGRQIPAQIDIAGSQLTLTIPLTHFPKLNGPIRWWVASLWGGFDLQRADASGDRVPDGDPAWFPEGSGVVPPTWDDLPSATVPLGLRKIQPPHDDGAAAELVTRMPVAIAGISREHELEHHATGEHPAAYGSEHSTHGVTAFALYLVALDATGPYNDWSPNTTGRDVIAFFASGIDRTVEGAGRDAQLGWVRWHSEERLPNATTTRVVYSMAWADADSHWYFTAHADSPEHLDALIEAFVETAGAVPSHETPDHETPGHETPGHEAARPTSRPGT